MALAGCTSSGSSTRETTTETTTTISEPDIGDFSDPDNWVVENGEISTQSTDPYSGTESIRLTCDHSDNRARARYDFPDTIDLTAHHLTYAFKTDEYERGNSNFQVQILAPDEENLLHYDTRGKPGDGWIGDALSTPERVVGYPNLHFVRSISFTQFTGGGANVDISIDGLQAVSHPERPTVLFTFDDGSTTVPEIAGPIMAEYGYNGAVAVIPGRETRPGFMTIDQMHDLQEMGWDIVSHPQVAERLPELPVERQRELITDAKRWLIDNGFESGSRFFVYPYSGWERETATIVDQHHELAFTGPGTTTWVPPDPIITPRIKGDVVQEIKGYVDRLIRYNGVMVLVYHSVGTDWISEADFRSIVEYINRSPVEVLTVSQWYDSYTS